MRLERHHDPAVKGRSRSCHHCRDLSWVMPVIVDDQHAAGFAVRLESAFGAVETGECIGNAWEIQADALTDSHGGQGILKVVTTRHGQL